MYQEDSDWEDIIPLPQDDGDQPLAQIAYTDEYTEAMSYLRAIMAKEEYSQRALEITEHITEMNPAHYTVWLYRAKVIFALNADLRKEIEFLNEKALRHEKNYQIWHHRQLVMDKLGDPTGESEFIEQMFEKDAKNYHVWSYRQWLVKRFGLWDNGELEYVQKLLERDVRNNSAWNHRYFLVFGKGDTPNQNVVEREM
ncbi:protein prenylyltransferase, partial [Wilcoxina mikolae CBS 423.85]